MMFECDKCGLCCRHIDLIPQIKEFDTGNGRCIHLSENNLCRIYPDKPEICNAERMYELYFKDKMSEEEYVCLNKLGCIRLKKLDGNG